MRPHVVCLIAADNQIFRTIVPSNAVQVMDTFVSCQEPSHCLFHDEPVFEDVTGVGVRMVRCVDVDIPGRVNVATASPAVRTWAFADVMPSNEPHRPTSLTSERRGLPAPALAHTRRLRTCPASGVHGFRVSGSRPMTLTVSLSDRSFGSAAAATQHRRPPVRRCRADKSESAHMPILHLVRSRLKPHREV